VDDLTDRVVAKRRYDTSGARVVPKPFEGGDAPFNAKIA